MKARDFFQRIFKNRNALDFEKHKDSSNYEYIMKHMSPQFKDHLGNLKEKIFSSSKNRYYDGVSFSPRMCINFINKIIEDYNNRNPINFEMKLVNKSSTSFGTRV